MAGRTVADELPPEWVEEAEAEAGHTLPHRLSEPPPGPAPADPEAVARVVDEVRRQIFPRHGLD
jgi:hypothetical protein